MDYASWKDRKALAAAIKPIYTAASAEAALAQLDAFEAGPWGAKFPTVAAAWRRNWDKVIPFFDNYEIHVLLRYVFAHWHYVDIDRGRIRMMIS